MNLLEQIIDTFQTFQSISEVTSGNAKKDILTSHKSNEVLKMLLYSTYSPFIQYNIKKIPLSLEEVKGTEVSPQTYANFLTLLVKLNKREISGNTAIEEYKNFLMTCTPEEYTWYTRVIKKDLGIGLAEKGINKVFKDLIPTYEVLLADKIPAPDLNLDTPKALKMLPERMVVQYKLDGYRMNIFVYDDSIEIRTRNGKFISGYQQLEKEALEKLPSGYVYDGELVSVEMYDWIESNMKSDTEVDPNREYFSEAMSHAFSHEENKEGIFSLFDMVPISEWNSRKPTQTLEQRTDLMDKLIKPLKLNHIKLVPTSRVYSKSEPEDLQEIVETFHKFLSWGWEGLMIKNWDSVYEFKRTKNLLKMKLMDSVDLEVIGVYEGVGKNSGKLGGVTVDYKGYEVGVGSGWSDAQREYYWENPNEIIGKTIEVWYQSETKNKKGGLSISFPVVKSIRLDK